MSYYPTYYPMVTCQYKDSTTEIPSCLANALATMLEIFTYREHGSTAVYKYYENWYTQGTFSYKWIYGNRILNTDTNEGMYISQTLPDLVNDGAPVYIHLKGIDTYPNCDIAVSAVYSSLIDEARNYKISSYFQTFDTTEVKTAIQNNGGVLIEMHNGDHLWNVSNDGMIAPVNNVDENYTHVMVVIGWTTINNVEHWIIHNNWGDWWGDSGLLYCPTNHSQILEYWVLTDDVSNYITYTLFPSDEPKVISRNDKGFTVDWSSIPNKDKYGGELVYRLYYIETNRVLSLDTQYTFDNLSYGTQYNLHIEAIDIYNNDEVRDISYTQIATVNPCPPTLSLISKTDNSISVKVDYMSGLAEGDIVYISPSGTQSSIETYPGQEVTFTGLTQGIEYELHAVSWVTGGDSSRLYSLTNGASIYITPTSRPSNFSWTTPKISGDPATNLTATEWNGLCTRINEFRQYKGLSASTFTTASSGGIFYASMFNQARNSIYDMNSTGLPSVKSSGDYLFASDLNSLVSCLNAIV